MLETEIVKTGHDFIQLRFSKRQGLSEAATIEITLWQHIGLKGDVQYSKDQIKQPFPAVVRLQPLPQGSMFKVVVVLKDGKELSKNTMYAFTGSDDKITDVLDETHSEIEQPRQSRKIENVVKAAQGPVVRQRSAQPSYNKCTTESLMLAIGSINKVQTKKKLEKTILDARKSSNMSDFINPYRGQRPDKREERLQRALLVSQGIQFFSDLYDFRDGNRMFRNDWFMGPFYCYDQNEKQLRKK